MNKTAATQRTKALFIGSNTSDSSFWQKKLSDLDHLDLEFVQVGRISTVDGYREKNAPDIVLLDLATFGGHSLNTYLTLKEALPNVPVITITELDDPELAYQIVSEGAQDCLSKADLDFGALAHAIRCAIARQKTIEQLRANSMIDELTGLYNRRGFFAMTEHQLRLAERAGKSLLLAFVDVDRLKVINDLLGHHRGDLALVEMARILRETFRKTDILARLGGDEFVAIQVCDKNMDPDALTRRFQEKVSAHNAFGGNNFNLSASMGVAFFDPQTTDSIDSIIEKADQLMYEKKNRREGPT